MTAFQGTSGVGPTSSAPVYFSIAPTDAGIMDQTMQFSAFYKLGLSLGYRYVHVPFVSWRSSAAQRLPGAALLGKLPCPLRRALEGLAPERFFDVYRFLGFNALLRSRGARPGPFARTLTITLNDDSLKAQGLESLAEVQEHVRARVSEACAGRSGLLVRFRLSRGSTPPRKKLFSMIHREIPRFRDGLNLRSGYDAARQRQPWPSAFGPVGIKLLVHIRQGDTAVIKTPWNTFIPVYGSKVPGTFSEFARYEDIPSDLLFSEGDFLTFVRGLASCFPPGAFSTLVFSDGYRRGFERLLSNLHRLPLTAGQVAALRDCQRAHRTYDEQRFSVFSQLDNTRCVIGETRKNLCDLIHSTLIADIVVTATQQWMLPNLTSAYGGEQQPVTIILYKGTPPDWGVIRSDHDRRFIYVNAQSPDYERLARKLAESIAIPSATRR